MGLRESHLEIQRGSAEEASIYCKKDGEFEEFGEISLNANDRRSRSREDICIYEIYARDVELLEQCRHQPREKRPHILYLHGKTGSGKTTSVLNVCKRLLLDYYVKPSA